MDSSKPNKPAAPSTVETGRMQVEATGDGIRVRLDAAAAQRFEARPNEWRLIPSGDDLVLMSPETRPPPGATGPKVPVAGFVEASGGLAEIIGFIHQSRWSGALCAVHEDSYLELVFRTGEVVRARSSRPEHRLGEILFRYGRVTRAQLQEALRSEHRLGRALVEGGLLGVHDVYTFVRKQVEEIFHAVLRLRAGQFWFVRTNEIEMEDLPDLSLSTQQLLFDGVRLLDELEYFRQRIPSSRCVPVLSETRSNLIPMEPHARAVLDLVDGERTVEEIGRESQLGELAATRVLFQLVQGGQVEIQPEGNVVEDIRRGIYRDPQNLLDFFNITLMRTRRWLEARGNAAILDGTIDAFASGGARHAALFEGVRVEADGRLDTLKILENLDRSVEPRDRVAVLSVALNELLSFVLFVVGDTVGARQQAEFADRLSKRPSPSTLDLLDDAL